MFAVLPLGERRGLGRGTPKSRRAEERPVGPAGQRHVLQQGRAGELGEAWRGSVQLRDPRACRGDRPVCDPAAAARAGGREVARASSRRGRWRGRNAADMRVAPEAGLRGRCVVDVAARARRARRARYGAKVSHKSNSRSFPGKAKRIARISIGLSVGMIARVPSPLGGKFSAQGRE